MKHTKIIVLCLFILKLFSASAGNDVPRQKVYSFIKVLQTKEWYAHQREVWGDYVANNKERTYT